MNQIKYILSACLILLMIFMGIFLYKTFPEIGIVAQDNPIIDNISSTTSGTVSSKGEQIFKQNCSSCHALDRDLTGPALHGVAQRGPWAADKNNLKKWIRNPLQFTSTNPYAIDLKKRFSNYQMPAQTQLSDADVEEVIGYITTK